MGCEGSKFQASVPQATMQRPHRGPVLLDSGPMPEAGMGQFHKLQNRRAAPRGQRGASDDKSSIIWRSDGGSTLAGGSGGQGQRFGPPALQASREPQSARGTRKDMRPQQGDSNSGSCSYVSEETSTSAGSARRQAGAGNFPKQLAPMDLVPTNFRGSDFDFHTSVEGGIQWSLRIDKLGFAARRFLSAHLGADQEVIRGYISEVHATTLSEEKFEALGIVREASLFAFTYPVPMEKELQISNKDLKVSDIALLVFGGFMYFDSDMVLQDVRALHPADNGPMKFCPGKSWPPDWTLAMGANRWKPVTLPVLRSLGVRYFTWLLPGELVAGRTEASSKHGGFAYIFHEPTETAVLQAQLDVYFDLVDGDDNPAVVDAGHPCPHCSRRLVWSNYQQGIYASGWDCEHQAYCGQRSAPSGTCRWFCQDCSFDICDKCHHTLAE